MKKLFVLIVSGLLSLTAMAQQSALVGTWQQLDNNGNPTTNVKIFMPDGKLLGQCFNDDFTVSSVWFMSNYKVVNDSSFVDHEFYHSNILYQRDYFFTFHKESDNVLVTSYIDNRNSALGSPVMERWKKMDSTMPTFTDAEWEALHQKSLVEFDRLPKEGQTVEQYADVLYKDFERYKSQNNQVRANEALLMRAELDTMNLKWQNDVILYYNMQLAVSGWPSNRPRRLPTQRLSIPTHGWDFCISTVLPSTLSTLRNPKVPLKRPWNCKRCQDVSLRHLMVTG